MLPRILEPEFMDTAEEARDYDSMDHAEVNRRFVDDLLAALSAFCLLPSAFDRPYRLLDLGTGTAQIPIELCRRVTWPRLSETRIGADFLEVIAVDAAAHMLALAQQNIDAAGFADRIRVQLADAKHLPFADPVGNALCGVPEPPERADAQARALSGVPESRDRAEAPHAFDAVISNSIIHHLPDPILCLREALRVVRSGGLLFFRDLMRPQSESELNNLVNLYAPPLLPLPLGEGRGEGSPDATGSASAAAHQRVMLADSLHAALTLDEIRRLATDLGIPAGAVQPTSDRHWTLVARR